MYRDIAKLVLYRNLGENSILMKLSGIFEDFDRGDCPNGSWLQGSTTRSSGCWILLPIMDLTQICGTIIWHLFLSQMRIHSL